MQSQRELRRPVVAERLREPTQAFLWRGGGVSERAEVEAPRRGIKAGATQGVAKVAPQVRGPNVRWRPDTKGKLQISPDKESLLVADCRELVARSAGEERREGAPWQFQAPFVNIRPAASMAAAAAACVESRPLTVVEANVEEARLIPLRIIQWGWHLWHVLEMDQLRAQHMERLLEEQAVRVVDVYLQEIRRSRRRRHHPQLLPQ
mmetsp:Transcript_81362/g.226588  ORF Transcript_81362/g.226588 Transcript_81362/m.226588 type:complete len:206 (-) Transcript_81362:1167-1784(-)